MSGVLPSQVKVVLLASLKGHGKATAVVFTHLPVIYRSSIMASLKTLVSRFGRASSLYHLIWIFADPSRGRDARERQDADPDDAVFVVPPDGPAKIPLASRNRYLGKCSTGPKAKGFTGPVNSSRR